MKYQTMKKTFLDVKGWTIKKGTKFIILKEVMIKNPMTQKTELFGVIRIDNGTDVLNLMPETCIKEIKEKLGIEE